MGDAPAPSWSGWPNEKLNRAMDIQRELMAEIEAWGKKEPARWVADQAGDRRSFELVLSVKHAVPVTRWSLLFGEYLHNARSALDALTWELCNLSGYPEGNAESIQFPAFTSREAFDDRGRGAVRKLQPHMPKLYFERLRELQPFQYDPPVNNPLHWLRILSNHEKHRALIAVDLDITGEVNVEMQFEPPPLAIDMSKFHSVDEWVSPPYPFEDGLRVQRHNFAMPWMSQAGTIRAELKILPVVADEDLGRQPISKILDVTSRQVAVALEYVRFGRLPPGLPPTMIADAKFPKA